MAIVRASFGLWLALTSTTLVAGTGSKNNSPITPTELGQRQHYPEAGQTAFYVPTHGMVQGNDPTIFQQPNWPEPKDPCSYGYMNIPSNDLDEDQPGSDPDESIEAEPSQLFYEQPPIAWPETQSFGLDASFVENSLLSGPFINHSPAEDGYLRSSLPKQQMDDILVLGKQQRLSFVR
ncbi:hypothetical protein H4R34_003691 [Dimargaris verticillata]|uniref:Uncharacterized protein n=1 Tax=Dimargaris verticillata TaxID=2761393 RepID=A0A9W8B1T8_9FUNG|nr:hypothetical protein H4R34_003691 [Dimargaris verticillata]